MFHIPEEIFQMKHLKELRIFYSDMDAEFIDRPISNRLENSPSQLDSLLLLHLFIYPNETVYLNLDDNHLVYDSTVWRTYFQASFPNLQEFSFSKSEYMV